MTAKWIMPAWTGPGSSQTPVRLMSDRCESVRYGTRCSSDGATLLTLGCIHEHTSTTLVCSDCLLAVRREIAAGNFACQPCEGAAQPHNCQVAEGPNMKPRAAS